MAGPYNDHVGVDCCRHGSCPGSDVIRSNAFCPWRGRGGLLSGCHILHDVLDTRGLPRPNDRLVHGRDSRFRISRLPTVRLAVVARRRFRISGLALVVRRRGASHRPARNRVSLHFDRPPGAGFLAHAVPKDMARQASAERGCPPGGRRLAVAIGCKRVLLGAGVGVLGGSRRRQRAWSLAAAANKGARIQRLADGFAEFHPLRRGIGAHDRLGAQLRYCEGTQMAHCCAPADDCGRFRCGRIFRRFDLDIDPADLRSRRRLLFQGSILGTFAGVPVAEHCRSRTCSH